VENLKGSFTGRLRYSSDVLTGASVGTAAMLLIGLFQRGMTDPAELIAKLQYRYGRTEKTCESQHDMHIWMLAKIADEVIWMTFAPRVFTAAVALRIGTQCRCFPQ
jgi:hypothetical protein